MVSKDTRRETKAQLRQKAYDLAVEVASLKAELTDALAIKNAALAREDEAFAEVRVLKEALNTSRELCVQIRKDADAAKLEDQEHINRLREWGDRTYRERGEYMSEVAELRTRVKTLGNTLDKVGDERQALMKALVVMTKSKS